MHATLSNLQWKDGKINVMDTPGASDFVGEVVAALRVCESAAVMVAARAGVQIETIKIWRRLDARNKPRIVFVNKLDEDMADFSKALADLKQKFDASLVPVTIPMGTGSDFPGRHRSCRDESLSRSGRRGERKGHRHTRRVQGTGRGGARCARRIRRRGRR
ncbi:GTP-binding protein [Halomonas sp.]|uniref:GTP-binding protein n=1 Tax=Halomonas sp. TaxID=1486246 RepID=UPI003A0FF6F9